MRILEKFSFVHLEKAFVLLMMALKMSSKTNEPGAIKEHLAGPRMVYGITDSFSPQERNDLELVRL